MHTGKGTQLTALTDDCLNEMHNMVELYCNISLQTLMLLTIICYWKNGACYGFTSPAIAWLESYLFIRIQRLFFNSLTSDMYSVVSLKAVALGSYSSLFSQRIWQLSYQKKKILCKTICSWEQHDGQISWYKNMFCDKNINYTSWSGSDVVPYWFLFGNMVRGRKQSPSRAAAGSKQSNTPCP